MERWKQINNLENYEVSNEGRVRNIKTGRIMKTGVNQRGYEIVTLRENKKPINKRVHKLVAEEFCDNYNPELDVTHHDGNRSNNNSENLTCKRKTDIIKDTFKQGRKHTHLMRKIMCVETGITYDSIVECAADMGIARESISKCVNNTILSTAGGYHFKPI